MSRISMAVFLALALSFSLVQGVSAQTTPAPAPAANTSADKTCPAPDTTHQYLGPDHAAFTVVVTQSGSGPGYIINLSRQACTQTCPSGGTIRGLCVSAGVCKASETCDNKAPQQPTSAQTGAGLSGGTSPQVTPDTNQVTPTPNQAVSQDFQSLGQSTGNQGSGLTTQNLLNSMQGQSILQQAANTVDSGQQQSTLTNSSVFNNGLFSSTQALSPGSTAPQFSGNGTENSSPQFPNGVDQAQVAPGTTFVPNNPAAGTLTAQNNSFAGAAGGVVSFFSGLLNGIIAPLTSAPAPAAQPPIVYSGTTSIVELSTDGSGAVAMGSNLPMPQITAAVPLSTGPSTGGTAPIASQVVNSNSNSNTVQTIIPGAGQTNPLNNSNTTQEDVLTTEVAQGGNGTTPVPVSQSSTQASNEQQQGTGATGNASSNNTQPLANSNPGGAQTAVTKPGGPVQPNTASGQSANGTQTGTPPAGGGQTGALASGANQNKTSPENASCQSLSCQTGQVLQKALTWVATNLNPISSAEAQPYNPQSGQPLADAVNSTCKVIGCNAPLMQQALGGVCAIESTCDSFQPHPRSQYQGFGQVGSAETQRAIAMLYQMSGASQLSSAEQAQMRSAAVNAQGEIARGINPNTDAVLGPWLLVGLHASLGTLQQVSAITNDPRAAAAYLENAQLAPVTFNGGFSPNKVLPFSAVTAYNQQGWIPISYGTTAGQAAGQMLGTVGRKIDTGIAYASQFTPSASPAPIPASYAGCNYQGCMVTPTIQAGNAGYAQGINRVSQCPSSGLCYVDPQTGAVGVPNDPNMTASQFAQAAREDVAMERLAQQGKLPQGAQFQTFTATLSAPAGVNASTPNGQNQLAGELAAGTGISAAQAQQIVASNSRGAIDAINAISQGGDTKTALSAIGLDPNTQVDQHALQAAVSKNNGISTTAATTQFTYTITDQNGNVLAQNVPLPQGAVGSDGTVRLLTDSNGKPLGQSGQLQDGQQPLLVSSSATLPPATQDPNNPNKVNFTDTRPAQPPQALGVTTRPIARPTPIGYPQQYPQQFAQQPAYAQPPYQTQPQPIPQPLPLPVLPTTPVTPTTPNPVVSIVANPKSVASGGASRISWNSIGTTGCEVTEPGGLQIGQIATSGSALSTKLSTTTVFTALCQTATSTVSATTSVTVQ